MSLLVSIVGPLVLSLIAEDPAPVPSAATLEGHSHAVLCAAVSPDGGTIVTGSEEPTVRVFDAREHTLTKSLEGNDGNVTALAFSADGTTLAVGDYYKKVRLWETKSWTLQRTLEVGGVVTALVFSADAKTLYVADKDNAVRVFDLGAAEDAKPRVLQHAFEVTALALTRDGSTLLTGDGFGTLTAWDLKTSEKTWWRTQGAQIEALALLDSDKVVACASIGTPFAAFDVIEGEKIGRFHAGELEPSALTTSLDGKLIYAGTREGPIHVLESSTGKNVRTVDGHTSIVTGLTRTADGNTLISTSRDATVRLSSIAPAKR
ncbi:MAG: PQQ-binding-like beta-propeller repeat protein [Planctomycetes bacterium]|nr:PQQ-binding-like beta-propeller repeat protein [Planctomycetota bacterium]